MAACYCQSSTPILLKRKKESMNNYPRPAEFCFESSVINKTLAEIDRTKHFLNLLSTIYLCRVVASLEVHGEVISVPYTHIFLQMIKGKKEKFFTISLN